MAQLTEDEGRNYEKYAVQVLEAATERGSDYAEQLLERLANPVMEMTN